MLVQKLENGLVALTLSPEDCTHLAQACILAAAEAVDISDAPLQMYADLAASVFHACAIALQAQCQLTPSALKALEADLANLGLSPKP